MSGTGSRPVSAMRPANTETTDGAPPPSARRDVAHLFQGAEGGDVELHAARRASSRTSAAGRIAAVLVIGILT